MNTLIRIRAIGLFCCLLLTHWAFSQTTTRYVSMTGITPAASATSWATSTTDLQGAIAASQPGDQVWVATGVYKPTSTTARDISFSMKNGVTIYGGFMIGQNDPGQRNVNPLTGNPSNTTLSGDIGAQGDPGDNSYHVISNPTGLTTTAVLDGFVITGGNATGLSINMGGGMYNNGSSPTLTNCLFQGNQATGGNGSVNYGGAMYNNNSNPVLTNCSFAGNQATGGNSNYGGAMYNDNSSSPVLTNCLFQGNQAMVTGYDSSYGGAMYNGNSSNPVLTNCSFVGNQATGGIASDNYGGAMYNISSSPMLTNCSFQSNQAIGINGSHNYGGAMYNLGNSNPVLTNCSFENNQAIGGNSSSNYGGAMYNGNSSNPVLTNCSLQNNKAATEGFSSINYGGAIYNIDSSNPVLTNCSLQNNLATRGGAIFNRINSNPMLTNSVVWNNGAENTFLNSTSTITARYSIFDASVTDYSGSNNLTATTSPFVSATSVALAPCSPAINTGDPNTTSATVGTTDLAGNPRISGNQVDMGAVEYQAAKYPPRLYVAASQTANVGDGQSWATAFPDLQSALTYPCSQSLTEIWVATGTYKPTSTTARSASFALLPGVAIIGGFMGSETAVSGRPTIDPVSGNPSSSTLSGDIDNDGTPANNSYHIVNGNGVTNTAVLDGFVITGGNANGGGDNDYGGAMFNYLSSPTIIHCTLQRNQGQYSGAIHNNGSSPALTNCSFQSNQAQNYGGAIYNLDSSNPTLTNCSLQGNQAGFGGVMYNLGSSPALTNCSLQSNQAQYGGAISNRNRSNPVLTNCSFLSNTATQQGGAMYNRDISSPVLTNCSLQSNQAQYGGAMYNTDSSPVLTNCSFLSNTATQQGGAMYNIVAAIESNPVLTNSVFFGNGGGNTFYNDGSNITATYSLFDNSVTGYSSSPTNLTTTTSPFVSTTSVALVACSPAINAGNPESQTVVSGPYSATTLPATDLTGSPRITGTRIDMGAVEYQNQNGVPLQIVQQPVAASVVCAGTTVVVSVSVTGSAPAYQWYRSGTALTGIASATTASLTLTNVQLTDAGSYSVVISGDCPSVTSTAFSLSVNSLPSVTVTAAPSATLSCTNPGLTLTAQTSATAFAWSSGGSTGQTLPVSQTGTYSVTVTDGNGCVAVSNSLSISRDNTSPTVSISAISNQLTCTQPQLTLTATASVTALLWSTGQTTTTISVSQTGTYSVTATGANGCTVVSNNLSVTENFSLPPFTVSSATVCPGQSVNLTARGCSGQILWSTGATTAMITLTAVSSTSLLTATCTLGSCSTTASGQVVVGGIQPPPAQILSFTADEAACPVRLTGRGVATSFTMTGPKDYVFSTVYREGATHEAIGLNVKQAGTYTLTATYTNSCGTSAPVTRTVTVGRNCP